MTSVALLQSLKESILSQANVKAIYGEPISAHGKTVIPVARIMYGYGAGAGTVSDYRKKLTGAVLAGIGFGIWLGSRTRR
jgi:uncharacterized spore protein YtfJ